jgi:hypothetical protein
MPPMAAAPAIAAKEEFRRGAMVSGGTVLSAKGGAADDAAVGSALGSICDSWGSL